MILLVVTKYVVTSTDVHALSQMLDAGLDKFQALKDAIKTGKFQLVITLLAKTKDNEVVQGVDKKYSRNLLHALAKCKNSQNNAKVRKKKNINTNIKLIN